MQVLTSCGNDWDSEISTNRNERNSGYFYRSLVANQETLYRSIASSGNVRDSNIFY